MPRVKAPQRRNWLYRRRLLLSPSVENSSLKELIEADGGSITLWHTPESGTPGLNAVTGAEDLTLTGTADGYTTGDAGQPLLTMSSSDTLTAESSFRSGTYFEELHTDMQFWFAFAWDVNGGTSTWQVLGETATGANIGYRIRKHQTGAGGEIYLHDGTINRNCPWALSEYGDFDNTASPNNLTNIVIVQFNIKDGWMETWVNGRNQRTQSWQRRDTSALTFPASTSPASTTVPFRCSADGNIAIMSGTGILSDHAIHRLTMYGRGLTWDEANTTDTYAQYMESWRVTPEETGLGAGLRVTGCFESAPTLKLYNDSNRNSKGSLLKNSGELELDDEGWCTYRFNGGLSDDTTYWVEAEYSDGTIDVRRARVKTLPTARDGIKLGFGSCWRFDPALDFSNAISLESASRPFIHDIASTAPDIFTTVGDDGYYDNMWEDLGNTAPIDTNADFQTTHEYIFARRQKLDELFSKVGFQYGPFSDHEYLENDTFGADATAATIAAAQNHWTQRVGQTFSLAPDNMYRSWQTPGITWISLDTRTEAETGVQLTSSGQRTQLDTDVQAAVGRDDLIILMCEFAWDEGETPSPPGSWNNFSSERQTIFNILADAGVRDRIICVYGDQHAGGVALDGTDQGQWDTNSLVVPIGILASRMNSPNAGSASGATTHPNYYDSGNGHWMEVDLNDSTTQFSFDYDAESSGPFTATETLTFGNGATATLDTLEDNGTTGRMWCTLLTGSKPSDNDTISGGTSGASANVDGGTPWAIDVTITPHENAVTKGPYSRTLG